MHFTPSIAFAIVAFASSTLAAPAPGDYPKPSDYSMPYTMTTVTRGWSGTTYGTGASTYTVYPSASSKPSNYSLSLTTYATTAPTVLPSTEISTLESISSTYTQTYSTGTPYSTYAPGTPPPQQTAVPAPAPTAGNPLELTKTQQLFIADTAVDRFNLLSDADLKFDFNDPEGKQKAANKGVGGRIIKADRKTFPALVSTGSGMAVGFLGACGFNTPHVHPRSVELQIVTKGSLMVEMLPENGVVNADKTRRVIRNEVTENQMTPFYMGSVHTQFNPNCYPVSTLSIHSKTLLSLKRIHANISVSLTGHLRRSLQQRRFWRWHHRRRALCSEERRCHCRLRRGDRWG